MQLNLDVLVVGCGDIGRRVATTLMAMGREVSALVRSQSSKVQLECLGIHSIALDLDHLNDAAGLEIQAQTVFYFAPPPPMGTTDLRMRAFLARLCAAQRLVYISTSGIYGDSEGAWVTEMTAPAPRTDRARRRLDAETQLEAALRHQISDLTLLRVPGIYSLERLPVERIVQKLPVVLPQEAPYSNRIHAEDLATACLRAGEEKSPPGIYNASDGHPSTMTDYFWHVADYLGLERPPAIPLKEACRILGPNMASFLEESRRLDNHQLLETLAVTLRYPNLDAALPRPSRV